MLVSYCVQLVLLTLIFCNSIDWSDHPIVVNGCLWSQYFLDTAMDLYLFQHVTQTLRLDFHQQR